MGRCPSKSSIEVENEYCVSTADETQMLKGRGRQGRDRVETSAKRRLRRESPSYALANCLPVGMQAWHCQMFQNLKRKLEMWILCEIS